VAVADASIDELYDNLRSLLKAKRQHLGLSLNEVSKRAGLNRMAVSFIERGLRVPSVATYARLASVLQTTPSALLAEAESKSKTVDWRHLEGGS
jgi:transcriptional regulator with XRE-family HTH domain